MMRLTVVCALALCAVSCVSKEEVPPSVLSEGCLINSDCASPLVCAFRRCHTQCDTVRDCPIGLECVPADRPFNVCLLPDETCRSQPCPSGLSCGADGLCRAPCGDDSTCLAEQTCVNGGVCASGVFLIQGRLPTVTDAGVPTCVRNSDCPQNLVCLAGACRVECLENRDCAPGLSCEMSTGLCVLPTPTNVTVPPTWSFVCALDIDCWNGLGAPPDDGGVVASDDPRALICGASSRCTYECTQGRQCASGVCGDFHCAPIEQSGTGGGGGGGATGGGGGGTSTGGGGGTTMLPDGGTVPVAVVSPTQTVAPGAVVTLSGLGSTGDGPLSYGWTQRMGSPVTLSANTSPTAFQPTFTAPSTPQVLRFELVVTDANNRVSSAASTSVIVGGAPTARFTPDGGLYGGGSLVQLISTSFDDAGLALTGYDWQLVAGSVGTLSSDGGSSAVLQLSNPTVAEGDVLSVVQLQVTNAIGIVSAPVRRSYVVRNASGENWVLRATGPANASYSGGASSVTLSASIDAGIAGAQVSYAWSCNAGVAVIGANDPTASYVTPVTQGATRQVLCSVTATAQPPLVPMTRTATVSTLVTDDKAPVVIDTGIVNGHEGLFGHVLRFDEPLSPRRGVLSSGSNYCNDSVGTGQFGYPSGESVNDSIAVYSHTVMNEGYACNVGTWQLTDLAGNSSATLGGQPTLVEARWEGPFVSTSSYADPRPVFVTLSQLPFAQFRSFGATAPTVQPYELVARENDSLVRFSFDPLATSMSCAPSCPVSATNQTVAGLGSVVTGNERRTGFDARSSYLTFKATDGGVLALERNESGTWAPKASIAGPLTLVQQKLGQARVIGNQLAVERYDRSSDTFQARETIGGAAAPIDSFEVIDDINISYSPAGYALIRRGTTWEGWTRTGTNVWSPSSPFFAPPADTLSVRSSSIDDGYLVEKSSAPYLVWRNFNSSGTQPLFVVNAPIVGYDVVRRGPNVYVVFSDSGDIKLYLRPLSGSATTLFGGPPRGSIVPPPAALDLDTTCEAVWPRLTLIQDALVVTWQERCSSGGPWKVVTRVLH